MERSIDDEVEHILMTLKDKDVSSEDYSAATKNLQVLINAKSVSEQDLLNREKSKLEFMKAEVEFKKAKWIVNPDTIVLAATNILGIVLILNYEHLHVVASKALSMVLRGRV